MNDDIRAAIDSVNAYGYCVLENLISQDMARSMAERFLEIHANPEYGRYNTGDQYYQTLFGMLNLDDRVWICASHPDTVAICRHFLGENCRVAEACSKPTWPGAGPQGLHVDSAAHFVEVPDVPWIMNSIWMLTDFTIENGATGIVPMSHRSRLKGPPPGITPDSPLIKPVTGRAGSVMMWHGGLYHMARPNSTTDEIRVGLNIAYYPRWFNNWNEGGHQPLWPETYERMPPEMKRLCPGRLGHNRADVYEHI
jgi:ectoine hydroxylase-related dioxygenase (phytanoyl-CoA dioxygenase family)